MKDRIQPVYLGGKDHLGGIGNIGTGKNGKGAGRNRFRAQGKGGLVLNADAEIINELAI